MKINFITAHFLPENNAATNRVLSYINYLEKKHFINIFCLTEKGTNAVFKNKKFSVNVTANYINQRHYNSNNFFIRALHEIFYAFYLRYKSSKVKNNLTILTIPYFFFIPIFAFFNKKKIILDIRDLTWEYLDETSLFNKALKLLIRRLIVISINKFNHIIVTNNAEKNWIIENTIHQNPLIISNGISNDKFLVLSQLKKEINVYFNIVYIGNIGLAQNLDTLIKAYDFIKDKKIMIYIIGDGNDFIRMENLIITKKYNNIKLLGKIDWNSIIKYYNFANVLYAQLKNNFESAVPSKLYEYAATGIPIIYAGRGEAISFLKNLENCFSIEPENSEVLSQVILKIYNSNDFSNHSNKNIQFIKNNFIRENLVSLIDELL